MLVVNGIVIVKRKTELEECINDIMATINYGERNNVVVHTTALLKNLAKKKHTFCYLLFIDLIICNAVIILIAYVLSVSSVLHI